MDVNDAGRTPGFRTVPSVDLTVDWIESSDVDSTERDGVMASASVWHFELLLFLRIAFGNRNGAVSVSSSLYLSSRVARACEISTLYIVPGTEQRTVCDIRLIRENIQVAESGLMMSVYETRAQILNFVQRKLN